MPTTKKEGFYFGLMMCSGMVIMMTFYNLITNGMISSLTVPEILFQLVLGFVIAFLMETFIVGPVAKKLAFSLPYDKSKKLLVILTTTLFMVTGMVLCMSVYGLTASSLANGLNGAPLLESYLSIVAHNFIFALPLQLIIIGPLVRYLFVTFVQGRSNQSKLA